MEDITSFFQKCLNRIPGVETICVSDREGVCILKVSNSKPSSLNYSYGFLAKFSVAAEQAGKLGAGKTKTMIAVYENHQMIHFLVQSIIVTLFASPDSNLGLIRNMEHEIREAVVPLALLCEKNS
eukprot:Sdes_comp19639_c0_seq3m11426